MDRGNGLQLEHYRVLRFPAWVVRYQPDDVAAQIRQALREAGYAC
jgi:very-short-patch-repair endonuclease